MGTLGVDRNFSEAFKFYKWGAALGDAVCLSHIGQQYTAGIGLDKDRKLGIQYIKAAADKGGWRS